jgi:hypothetical protein
MTTRHAEPKTPSAVARRQAPGLRRRAFVRVAGGGVILAAAGLGTGCSRQVPAEAIEGWNGPSPGEPDVRRWALAHAILAPHSHNLQSWLVDLRTEGEILLRCDLQRLLPVTDPLSRQIMMSHGTFIELLDLAARERGLRTEVELFPEGAFGPDKLDQRPVARIRLRADAGISRDALFGQLFRRHTNRNAYDAARAVPAAAWRAMQDAAAPYPVSFGYVGPDQAQALARHRAIASEAWRIELTTPAAILESFKLLRIGAGEVAQHRDGLTLMDPMVVWLNRLGLFDRTKAPQPDDFATTSQIKDFNTKIASTVGFLWMTSNGNDRATQVQAGRAYARVQLAATAQGVVMQPLQQALQEYPEQARMHAEIHRLLGATAPAQTVQMWARVGFAPPVEPAPRRPLDAFVVKT